MDAREQRGQAIAATNKLTQKGDAWLVPSQSGNGRYTVFPDKDKPRCTCLDHLEAGYVCKHIHAVLFVLQRTTQEHHTDGSVTTTTETIAAVKTTAERRTYAQPNWHNYNLGQVNERRHFHELLADLCSTIPDPEGSTKGGRPAIPMRDAVFSACLKVYSLTSARRFSGELQEASEAGFVTRTPSFNSVLGVFSKPETTAILKSMIERSALPRFTGVLVVGLEPLALPAGQAEQREAA
jgi:hypothetical protein